MTPQGSSSPGSLVGQALVAQIKLRARALGFDLVGIAPAHPSAHRDYLQNWLGSARHGTMHWLTERIEERADVGVYLPEARSVICVAINYHSTTAAPPEQGRAIHGKIAQYALGRDYHDLLKHRLYDLADWLREVTLCRTRTGVDTVPVLERELAARAGIGWIGKNTCVIHPTIGSWLLLGEIVTTLELPYDAPATDHCGTCRRCIDACPTAAIVEPFQLDASRCISYLTIEHREDDIPADLRRQTGQWLFGCDICQEVCPFNAKAPPTGEAAFAPRFADGSLDARQIVDWTLDQYHQTLRGSAIKRVKLPQLQRNARTVIDNAGKG